jgi:hypothetical protein
MRQIAGKRHRLIPSAFPSPFVAFRRQADRRRQKATLFAMADDKTRQKTTKPDTVSILWCTII